LSIITINLNNSKGLLQTIKSVVEQDCDNYEYIIIDGCSKDESCDVLSEYDNEIDYWVSEPDNGIYSAMNKAIRKANGEYCLFLNSGDVLYSRNVVNELINEMQEGFDVYYSNPIITNDTECYRIEYPDKIDIKFFLGGTLNHQNTVIKKELLMKLDLYREDFKVAADWFFFLKATYLEKCKFKKVNTPIAIYRNDGLSGSKNGSLIDRKEREQGIREVFGDLGDLIIELNRYRESLFGNIIRLFGYSKVLYFILLVYRFFARRLPFLHSNKHEP